MGEIRGRGGGEEEEGHYKAAQFEEHNKSTGFLFGAQDNRLFHNIHSGREGVQVWRARTQHLVHKSTQRGGYRTSSWTLVTIALLDHSH